MASPAQKILAQSAPSATTNTDIYEVPTASSATVSSLIVCNRSTATSFRVAVRRRGEPISDRHYLYYDTAISQNATIPVIVGMTLSAGDIVTVYATASSLSFTLFGVEVS